MHKLLVLGLLVSAPALAEAPAAATVVIEGKWAFDTMQEAKAKCAKVQGALLDKMRKLPCEPRGKEAGSNSGKTILAECRSTDSKKNYLVFESAADCKAELEAIQANAP